MPLKALCFRKDIKSWSLLLPKVNWNIKILLTMWSKEKVGQFSNLLKSRRQSNRDFRQRNNHASCWTTGSRQDLDCRIRYVIQISPCSWAWMSSDPSSCRKYARSTVRYKCWRSWSQSRHSWVSSFNYPRNGDEVERDPASRRSRCLSWAEKHSWPWEKQISFQ